MRALAERAQGARHAIGGDQRRRHADRPGSAPAEPGITELRPGNYVYFDRTQVGLGAARLDDCALTVLATVVSKPDADRIILDSGTKTLSSDGARGFTPLPGFGAIFEDLEQHGRRRDAARRAAVGGARHRSRHLRPDRARAGRPRPHPPQSRLRRLEPGRRGPLPDGGEAIVETVRVAARGKIVEGW